MLVEASIWTVARTDHGNAVLIRPKGKDITVPIFIGQLEAQSILIGLGSVQMPRPLTHDLIRNILSLIDCRLVRVEITALTGGTFYAQLIVSKGKEVLTIDARPSDSIALAVREKCPIFIEQSVLDTAGISVDTISMDIDSSLPADPENSFHNSADLIKDNLQGLLDKAVTAENYEEAARIRDKISDLEHKNRS